MIPGKGCKTQLIAVSDMQDLPAIGKIPLLDILSESNRSVAVDRNV